MQIYVSLHNIDYSRYQTEWVSPRSLRDSDQDVRQEVAVPGLNVITSGPLPPNPSELLASDVMDEVRQSLASKAEIVIYDTPPLTVVTDAVILGTKVDGALLVVRLEKHPEKQQRGPENPSRHHARKLGIVVNDVENGTGYSSYYYYYYGNERREEL